MRNDALNANIIQLICLDRIIIQDREGQQCGICRRIVNLKKDVKEKYC